LVPQQCQERHDRSDGGRSVQRDGPAAPRQALAASPDSQNQPARSGGQVRWARAGFFVSPHVSPLLVSDGALVEEADRGVLVETGSRYGRSCASERSRRPRTALAGREGSDAPGGLRRVDVAPTPAPRAHRDVAGVASEQDEQLDLRVVITARCEATCTAGTSQRALADR
jgi:hypothetical protein